MRAYQIVRNGAPDKAFELVEIPEPSRSTGQILIDVEAFGLNYADVMARNGLYREAPPLPFVPGYEVVGRIREADDSSLIGKRVIAFTRFGGYSEVVVTSENGFVEIDEDVSAGEAVAMGTQYVTAYHAAYETINLFPGDKVLIHAAAGGVGIALTQLAKLKGCEIYGTASKTEKLEFISKNGVDYPINYLEQDYETVIRELIRGNRLDVAFNSIGGSAFKKDGRLIGTAGRRVLYGGAERSGKRFGFLSTLNFVRKMGLIIPIGFLIKSQGVIGVNMLKIADNKPEIIQRCMKEVYDLYKRGELKPHIGGSFTYEQIAEAHALLEGRNSIGKIVVSWK